MSESETPLILFKTPKNTELGATSISVGEDGTVAFHDVLKLITESMLTSYPRTQLGTWTPNRAAIRFARDEVAQRSVRDFATGKQLDLEGILALAS